MELCLELSLSFFCAVYIVLLGQCYVAMPLGYKLVITRALGLHGIYCTQPSGLAPSCFSAIYSIHPSCPCYNYNLLSLLVSPPQKLQCTRRIAGFLSSLDPQYSCGLVGILSHHQCRKDRGRHRIHTPQVDSLGVRKSTDIYMGILIAVGSTYHL